MDQRTIVAPMTPAGVSAVAAIRVSGPQVRDVVLALFGERAVARLESHRARLGTARDPKTGEPVDSLLYLFTGCLRDTLIALAMIVCTHIV